MARSLAHSWHGAEVFIYKLKASISYSFIPLYTPSNGNPKDNAFSRLFSQVSLRRSSEKNRFQTPRTACQNRGIPGDLFLRTACPDRGVDALFFVWKCYEIDTQSTWQVPRTLARPLAMLAPHCSLRTARFTHVLRCAYPFVRCTLTRSRAWGKEDFIFDMNASF